MTPLKNVKGMTLVEIIVAIAILGMIVVAISGMLNLSASQLFESGFRTKEVMVVQEVVDLLQKRNNTNMPVPFVSDAEMKGFLNPYTTNPDYKITYVVSSKTTINDVSGWNVTIKKSIQNGTKTVQLSTFVVNFH